jgi:YbgC/YbaW family acyl-CoA thioester hydrolase
MREHTIKKTIAWGDLDALGIVFYPRYYEWIDASAHLFFDAIQLNIARLWNERNILFGLAETSCRYLKSGRYHQEIEIGTRIESLEKKIMVLRHEIKDRMDGSLMMVGREKRICMDVSDPERFYAVDIPNDIYSILKDAAR